MLRIFISDLSFVIIVSVLHLLVSVILFIVFNYLGKIRPVFYFKGIEIDLVDQKIHKGDNRPFDFEIEPFRKECLLNGYDDIALTLKKVPK